MPNIMISDLAPVTLPIDPDNSFFEVQTIEAGIKVSRKITADEMGIGGSVMSVNSGVNITVDNTDPLNPIVNLNAAITGGVSVNGVTLDDAGVATNFLDETGNYSAPAGGIGGSIADNQIAIGNGVDAIDGSADFTWDGSNLTLANATSMLIRDGAFLRMADPTDTSFLTLIVDAANDIVLTGAGSTVNFRIPELEIRLEDSTFSNWLSMVHTDPFAVFSQVNTQGLKFDDLPLYLEERAAANADELTYGQLWVNSATGNLNFTDELGADTDLIAAAFDPTADIDFTGACTFTNAAGDLRLGVSTSLFFRNNADTSDVFIQNLGPTFQFGIAGADFGSGIFEIGSSWLKLQVNRSIFFDEKAAQGTPVAGDGEFWVRSDSPNVPMFTDDAGTDFVLNASGGAVTQLEDGAANPATVAEGLGITAIRSVGNTDGEGREVEWQNQNGTTRASLGTEFFTDFIMRNHLVGGSLIFRVGTGGGSRIRAHMDGDAAAGGFSAYAGTSAVPRLQTLNHGVEVGNGTLFLVEQAAPEADIASQGQLWVDSSDDALHYITEAGVDFDLTAGGAVSSVFTRTGAVVGVASDYATVGVTVNDSVRIDFGTGNDFQMQFDGSNMSFVGPGGGSIALFSGIDQLRTTGALAINEAAAPDGNVAGIGQWWVRSAAPCRPMFTDDTDVDQEMDPSRSDLNTQNGNYTLLMTDKGKTIYKASGGAGETITIPANASVPFQIGTWVAFDNDGGGALTIAITSDTLTGTDAFTGSRTLGTNARALIQKIGATEWRYQATDI